MIRPLPPTAGPNPLLTDEVQDTIDGLTDATDKLNEALAVYEAQLGRLALGVGVWVMTVDPTQNRNRTQTQIGYRRIEGRWQLCVWRREGDQAEPDIWPALQAPRELRLHCYKNLHVLLPAMLRAANSLAVRIEQALARPPADPGTLVSPIPEDPSND
jgi:hypothetical protein